MIDQVPGYRGRFAPSPTGPLHFGSLIAAVGSYLQALHHQGDWLVRMEDVDTTRSVDDADDAILFALEDYGFEWQGQVMRQSERGAIYESVLAQLKELQQVYPCSCSRKQIQARIEDQGLKPGIYPGTCRHKPSTQGGQQAWRLRVGEESIGFDDPLQGHFEQKLTESVGDFVLRRADGLYAYQLAVVVDDAEQGITEVVRGCDLLDNTPRQIYLQALLGYPRPNYVHLPIAVNAEGQKLSKQTRAAPLDRKRPGPVLWRALDFLGQQPPTDLESAPPRELWAWAGENWSLAKVPPAPTITISPS
ncbi:MAG: tRNA glutamyl-Q(34) synthetase GluQRS [Gammaproteobacteria bacterium]|nr:tRNA glutamyl-Q(34) synthetase GluQRS [Gammaproteobacteria bacterium]